MSDAREEVKQLSCRIIRYLVTSGRSKTIENWIYAYGRAERKRGLEEALQIVADQWTDYGDSDRPCRGYRHADEAIRALIDEEEGKT